MLLKIFFCPVFFSFSDSDSVRASLSNRIGCSSRANQNQSSRKIEVVARVRMTLDFGNLFFYTTALVLARVRKNTRTGLSCCLFFLLLSNVRPSGLKHLWVDRIYISQIRDPPGTGFWWYGVLFVLVDRGAGRGFGQLSSSNVRIRGENGASSRSRWFERFPSLSSGWEAARRSAHHLLASRSTSEWWRRTSSLLYCLNDRIRYRWFWTRWGKEKISTSSVLPRSMLRSTSLVLDLHKDLWEFGTGVSARWFDLSYSTDG